MDSLDFRVFKLTLRYDNSFVWVCSSLILTGVKIIDQLIAEGILTILSRIGPRPLISKWMGDSAFNIFYLEKGYDDFALAKEYVDARPLYDTVTCPPAMRGEGSENTHTHINICVVLKMRKLRQRILLLLPKGAKGDIRKSRG